MKRQRDKYRQIARAMGLIEEFLANPTLRAWERASARQAAKCLRALTRVTAPAPIFESYLTPREVAERFLVSPITVRQWAAKGKLPSITTPGGHRRFPIASVEHFALKYRC